MNPGVRVCAGITDIWLRHANLPEIAVLPELTLGGVQMAGSGVERTAAEESQSAQDGETKGENDSLWRNAA